MLSGRYFDSTSGQWWSKCVLRYPNRLWEITTANPFLFSFPRSKQLWKPPVKVVLKIYWVLLFQLLFSNKEIRGLLEKTILSNKCHFWIVNYLNIYTNKGKVTMWFIWHFYGVFSLYLRGSTTLFWQISPDIEINNPRFPD